MRTIALATLFALSSTFALADENPATGAQGGATGVPGVKTNPTQEKAAKGARAGPKRRTNLHPARRARTPAVRQIGVPTAPTRSKPDKVNSGNVTTGPTPIK